MEVDRGLFGGVLVLLAHHPLSACCVAFGIAGFIPSGYSYFPLWVDPNQVPCNPVWQVYVFMGGIIALTILGIILQACLFSREITWDKLREKKKRCLGLLFPNNSL